jgi:hypothetical protein
VDEAEGLRVRHCGCSPRDGQDHVLHVGEG